jgi:hypothetical protein
MAKRVRLSNDPKRLAWLVKDDGNGSISVGGLLKPILDKPSYSIQVYNESQEIYWEGGQESKNEAIVRARYLVDALSKINWKASISADVEDYLGQCFHVASK